jgi:hypothetical protein
VIDVGFAPAVASALEELVTAGNLNYERVFLASGINDMVRGFIDAVAGYPVPLEHLGRAQAVDFLLHPPTGLGAQQTLVVREPEVLDVRVTAIDEAAAPATLDVVARLRAYCWLADRDSAELRLGYRDAPTVVWLFLTIAPEGPEGAEWQMIKGHTATEEQIYGYRYVTRQETEDEYRERTGSSDPASPNRLSRPVSEPQASGAASRSYRITGSWADHDYRVADRATVLVTLPSSLFPERADAERLLWDDAEARFKEREPGAGDFQPTWSALEVVELRPDPDP